MMDEEEDNKQHFSLKAILEKEKEKKGGKKKKSQKKLNQQAKKKLSQAKAEKELQQDFKVNACLSINSYLITHKSHIAWRLSEEHIVLLWRIKRCVSTQ